MAIYELNADSIVAVSETSFSALGISERGDLQRLLRRQVDVIAPDTLVISEEFGEWEDSRRRIDLLAIDKEANLVVIELKRTEDGGHMELQALRYAAMVSAMTFERATKVFEEHLKKCGAEDTDPAQAILEFLGWDEPLEDDFAQDVRIVLASAEFSRELTTAVLWLNERGLDIRCVRIKPYSDASRKLIDVQQVIPLPEAEEYQVRIKEKHQRERRSRGESSGRDYTKYDVVIDGDVYERLPKRRAIFYVVRALMEKGVTPDEICRIIPWRPNRMFRKADGCLDSKAFCTHMEAQSAKAGERFTARYWRVSDDQLIRVNGCTYAFHMRWGPKTHEAIVSLLKAFPNRGVECTQSEELGS